MQTTASLTVRTMRQGELALALDWAAAEGWNPGCFDATPFWAVDPAGFFLAELDGEPVGSFSAVAYDERFGFAGLLVVRPEFRGGQCGPALVHAGLAHLAERTVGLDGVVGKQGVYAEAGFVRAYRTLRFQGVADLQGRRVEDSPAQLVDLRAAAPDALARYDAQLFPAMRSAFLESWISQPGTIARGILRAGTLAGIGVVRPCRAGYKIGPLAADDPALAEILMEALLATIPQGTFSIDVPEPNEAGLRLAERYRLRCVFETARMYRGPAPALDLPRLYGVTSLELG